MDTSIPRTKKQFKFTVPVLVFNFKNCKSTPKSTPNHENNPFSSIREYRHKTNVLTSGLVVKWLYKKVGSGTGPD